MATKPNIQWVASPNFSKGRNRAIRAITFHHVVGSDDSAISKFKNPASQSSSTYVVGDTKITQMVSEKDTPWTNSNFTSNSECITIEHEGDWRNGYRNEKVIENSAKLVAWIRSRYPTITFNRHREVSLKGTVCPADLPVEEIWNRATQILNPPRPKPEPAPPVDQPIITDIANKIMIATKDVDLWDLTFNTWAEAKSLKKIPKGTEIEVSALARHKLGGTYAMTEYSFSKGIMNGINIVDLVDKPTEPEKPPVEPCEGLQEQIEKLQHQIELKNAEITGLTQTIQSKDLEIEAQAEIIKELKAELAIVGEDTKNLNALGEMLRWFIERIGLKK